MSAISQKVKTHLEVVGDNVTDAAHKLGVGRPALSSFVNGRSVLSLDLALKLEKVYAIDGLSLLEQQLRAQWRALKESNSVCTQSLNQ